jgi:hypothetical protein
MVEDPCPEARKRLQDMIMAKISRLLERNVELSTQWARLFGKGDPSHWDIKRTMEEIRAEADELMAEWVRVGDLTCDKVHDRSSRHARDGFEKTPWGKEGLHPDQLTTDAFKRSLDAMLRMFKSDLDRIVNGPADTIQSTADYYAHTNFSTYMNALDGVDSAAVAQFESEASAKIMEMIIDVGQHNAYFAYDDDEIACGQTAIDQIRQTGSTARIEAEVGLGSFAPGDPMIVEALVSIDPDNPISTTYQRCIADVGERRDTLAKENQRREQALATLQVAFISMTSARAAAAMFGTYSQVEPYPTTAPWMEEPLPMDDIALIQVDGLPEFDPAEYFRFKILPLGEYEALSGTLEQMKTAAHRHGIPTQDIPEVEKLRIRLYCALQERSEQLSLVMTGPDHPNYREYLATLNLNDQLQRMPPGQVEQLADALGI